jgi:hypothetical protein
VESLGHDAISFAFRRPLFILLFYHTFGKMQDGRRHKILRAFLLNLPVFPNNDARRLPQAWTAR